MAKTPVNTALGEVKGRVDDWVFRVVEGDKVIARRPRPREDNPTEDQKVQRESFRRAAAFAKAVFSDPARKASYAQLAAQRGTPASRLFSFIVQDFAKPPQITGIDATDYRRRIGDAIRVFAIDDGEVAKVTVRLLGASSAVIEEGPAAPVDGHWAYVATTAVPAGTPLTLEVTAEDRPRNKTTRTEVLSP